MYPAGDEMKSKAVNLGLLTLMIAAVATGFGSFLVGSPSLRPIIWAHAAAGFTIVALFWWKRRVILRSLRRRGASGETWAGIALLAGVALVLLSGIGSATIGLPSLGAYSALTIHAVLGTAAAAVLVLHSHLHWPKVRRTDRVARRNALRFAVAGLGGVLLWRATEGVSAIAGLSGARRRFTGSHAVAAGEPFPETQWLTDNPAPLDRDSWRLRVHGQVDTPLALAYGDLAPSLGVRATIDCTGGWYAERRWDGVALAMVLAAAGVQPGARSVVVRASTGYWRRYTLAAARGMLLATWLDGEPLSHGHGAPLRLVAPGDRGYEWVKWVTEIEVSTVPAWLNWPLPV